VKITPSIEFVNKQKWRILFVPWKDCETGIMVHCDALFTLDEFKEFYLDLWKALFKRYEKTFPNDVKSLHNVHELAEMLMEDVDETLFL